MSWLSKLFSIFTGGQAKVNKRLNRASKTAAHDSQALSSCPENTLGWLLKQNPDITSYMAYDVSKPHSIHPGVLGRLRTSIHEIPPMPESWRQIQRALQQPDASASDLGAVVANDPVLTARILTTCNSSAYATAGSSEINNIPLAIARLGLDETSNIIFQTLAPKLGESPEKRLQARHIWMHSQTISTLMRLLSESCTQVSRNDASLTGMLHDIGKLVILHIEDQQKLADLKASIDGGLSTLEAEYHHLGYTHIDSGMMLALHWQLPKYVQHFISFHHHAAHLPAKQIPSHLQHAMMMLNLAHIIARHSLSIDVENGNGAIWQSYQRQFAERPEPFVKLELSLPLDSQTLYQQLQLQVERIKPQFPDLYPTTNE
ncbi:HDOD domain protein [Mariprofundus micogutta]|uniref:HDOD domain protein n=2 Tax=Mariprofundus micogutta TaxID=1921010 RepID=A0A1L8CMC1_9PROT|nr:HDOD domain protein [Mariprofundus micogutta]